MGIKKIYGHFGFFISLLLIASNNFGQNYKVSFPLNSYLLMSDSLPYPVVDEKKIEEINPRSFVNVMNFGAAGDGVKNDEAAIQAAFAACESGGGVLFPKGKTFLIKDLIHVPLKNDITVYAYGATFKMDDNTGYNAIAIESTKTGYNSQVLWLGGTFDGNKNKQSWPGSPSGNNDWTVTQGNYGFLTIRSATFALVKDVQVINTVYDGVELFECKLGVFADSKGEGAAPLNNGVIKRELGKGRQATYFKITRTGSQAAYFLNLECKGGSIGIQFSAKPVNDSSLAIVNKCKFYNQAQDAMHFELCRYVFIYKCFVHADNTVLYQPDVHISNVCEYSVIQDSRFENGRIDFRTANKLQAGIVKNCQFISSAVNDADTTGAVAFIENATHVINCAFNGWTRRPQVSARYVQGCTFSNFNTALSRINIVKQCGFENGDVTLLKPRDNPNFIGCTYKKVNVQPGNLAAVSAKSTSSVDALFKVSINVTDEQSKYLGKIGAE